LATRSGGWIAIAAALLAFHPPAVRAAEPETASPYQIRWRTEVSVLALSGIASLAPEVFRRDLGSDACPCDRGGINSLDRGTAGRDSKSADRASTVAAGLLIAAPFALDAIEVHRGGGERSDFTSDAVVILESVAVTTAITQVVKAAVRRPRPFLYDRPAGDPALIEKDSYRSFFSLHTSAAFAAGISYARTFALRHPQSPSRWAVYGAAVAGGGAVAALRVSAGQHFPTDVIAGALVGAGTGFAIPELHRREGGVRVSVIPRGDGAVVAASVRMR
jgi:membrane-associated phospholipid phosphatase